MFDVHAQTGTIMLSVVVPCFNERENVPVLVQKLEEVLAGIDWEVVFVDDDSPDGTASAVRALAASRRNVRCVQRIGRRGLSTAVIEGILSTSAPYIAVMDGDLQHDETLLPRMLQLAKSDGLDVVVASRYTEGGSTGDWDNGRQAMSGFATRLAHLIVDRNLTDPMSGFFIISRPAFDSTVRRLSGQGFKILLDLFASAPRPFRFAEVPFTFRTRLHGESKLDSLVLWEYLTLLLDKLVGRWVPVRFVMFSAVGASGVLVHFAVLAPALNWLSFTMAQTLATGIAMVSNFLINNALTYRDRRLRGFGLITGLLTFMAVCSVGVVANVGVASAVFNRDFGWWLAALAGIAVGVVWNYAVSQVFTWRKK